VKPLIETHVISHRLAVVCTNRGQHKRIRLTTVTWWAPVETPTEPDQLSISDSGRHWGGPIANPQGSALPYEFWCGVCHRHTQIKAERWLRLVEGTRDAAMGDLDVAYLD